MGREIYIHACGELSWHSTYIYVMSQHEQYINMIKKMQVSIYTAVLTYTAVVFYTPLEALYVYFSICKVGLEATVL